MNDRPALRVESFNHPYYKIVWRLYDGGRPTPVRFTTLRGGMFWVKCRPDKVRREMDIKKLRELGAGDVTLIDVTLLNENIF